MIRLLLIAAILLTACSPTLYIVEKSAIRHTDGSMEYRFVLCEDQNCLDYYIPSVEIWRVTKAVFDAYDVGDHCTLPRNRDEPVTLNCFGIKPTLNRRDI